MVFLAEASAVQVMKATEAIDFLVTTRKQEGDSMQRMADKTLACLSKFEGKQVSTSADPSKRVFWCAQGIIVRDNAYVIIMKR